MVDSDPRPILQLDSLPDALDCQRLCQQRSIEGAEDSSVELSQVLLAKAAELSEFIHDLGAKLLVSKDRQKGTNDPSSATRPTRRVDCNRSAMAGFAAAHG